MASNRTFLVTWYGVATISRFLKIIGLFCKRALQKRLYSAKLTYYLKDLLTVATPYSQYSIQKDVPYFVLSYFVLSQQYLIVEVWSRDHSKWRDVIFTTTHCHTLQHTATHCNTLQHTATHCNILQHTATHFNTLQHTATHCNTLQHTATHCNTLQHIATHSHTLQHTATQG